MGAPATDNLWCLPPWLGGERWAGRATHPSHRTPAACGLIAPRAPDPAAPTCRVCVACERYSPSPSTRPRTGWCCHPLCSRVRASRRVTLPRRRPPLHLRRARRPAWTALPYPAATQVTEVPQGRLRRSTARAPVTATRTGCRSSRRVIDDPRPRRSTSDALPSRCSCGRVPRTRRR